MGNYRRQRIESVMQHLLAQEIVRSVQVEGVLITITGVDVDEKEEKATVHMSVYPDEYRERVLKKLNGNAPDLAWFLLKKMKVKKVPELVFK